MLEKWIVDQLAFKYYGNTLSHPKLSRSSHIYPPMKMVRFTETVHLNYVCKIIGGSMKEIDWQKTELIPQLMKNDLFKRSQLECQAEKVLII